MARRRGRTAARAIVYSVRYVHKVATSANDVGDPVRLSEDDLADARTLGAALRRQKTLLPTTYVREYRIERDGRVVVFPAYPGLSTYWHSIILTPGEK